MPMLSPEGAVFTVKKNPWKFWYTGACFEPGCTLFPPPPNFSRSLFGKMRNRAAIIAGSSAGTNAVVFSKVKKTESRRGCDLGRSWYRLGDVLTLNFRDDEGFYGAEYSYRPDYQAYYSLYTSSVPERNSAGIIAITSVPLKCRIFPVTIGIFA